MNLDLIPYSAYERGLPQEGNFVLGQHHNDTIIVYQAFNDRIADYAVANQQFGGPDYSFSRMTWIKPNFLWMMYRSGWAQKENQNRILAIEMTYNGFMYFLKHGVLSSYDPKCGSHDEWKKQLNESDIRIQWDPDHGPHGEKLKRRAVQIGIADEALKRFHESIESITDITPFVNEQYPLLQAGKSFAVVFESVVPVYKSIQLKYVIPEKVDTPAIDDIIHSFEQNGEISAEAIESFLSTGSLREELTRYIRNYTHKEFSRALLHAATNLRREEQLTIMSEDLLLFAWFVSKNKELEDLTLIVNAKVVDFDSWVGFDGSMVYSVLDFEATQEYLRNNADKHPEANLRHLLENYDESSINEYRKTSAFWYLY